VAFLLQQLLVHLVQGGEAPLLSLVVIFGFLVDRILRHSMVRGCFVIMREPAKTDMPGVDAVPDGRTVRRVVWLAQAPAAEVLATVLFGGGGVSFPWVFFVSPVIVVGVNG
jgi:hypothetical protein